MVLNEQLEAAYAEVVPRNPGETEFHQAVRDVSGRWALHWRSIPNSREGRSSSGYANRSGRSSSESDGTRWVPRWCRGHVVRGLLGGGGASRRHRPIGTPGSRHCVPPFGGPPTSDPVAVHCTYVGRNDLTVSPIHALDDGHVGGSVVSRAGRGPTWRRSPVLGKLGARGGSSRSIFVLLAPIPTVGSPRNGLATTARRTAIVRTMTSRKEI